MESRRILPDEGATLPISVSRGDAEVAEGAGRPPRARLLVVSDVRLYREGLVYCLRRRPAVSVVGTAATTDEALRVGTAERPDVVLIDITMPDALAATRTLSARLDDVKIIALAVSDRERDIVACAEAGVVGYVQRDGSLDDLLATIESAARGELLCAPRIAAALLRRLRGLVPPPRDGSFTLTAREQEILRLIDQGMANKEIARSLSIGVTTVKNHVHHILEKLNVQRRGQAVALARGYEGSRLARREAD